MSSSRYPRRIERGLAKGLTRSQARGHPRASEAPIKGPRAAIDPRLATGMKAFAKSRNVSKAAKEAGVSPERLRAFIRHNKIAERKGTRWQLINRQVRVITRGRERWIKVGFETASLVGRHNEALKRFRHTNDFSALEPFRGQAAVDLGGRKHPLETRPNVLRRRFATGGETFEHVYRLTT